MIDLGKHNVLGIHVDAIDYEAAVARVVGAAKDREPMSVTALAVHGVMTGVHDREHQFRLNEFDLVCPDGQPVRWALNSIHRCDLADRVYGPELTLRLCDAAAAEGLPIFLFGATEEMLDKLCGRLHERLPGLKIAGMKPSRFRKLSDEECVELAAEINESGARVCFVGLGCPRQEIFAYEMRRHISMPLIAVGAAFAFHAGVLPQAPPWMQRRGLEWAYRLAKEPRRLFKRYATTNPAFATLAVLQKMGWYRADASRAKPPETLYRFG